MTIGQILDVYDRWFDMIIRVYHVEDYGNENKAKTVYPMGYGYELPSKMVLGDYRTMMSTEIKTFKTNESVAIHFYI